MSNILLLELSFGTAAQRVRRICSSKLGVPLPIMHVCCSFFTARQQILGYSVPHNDAKDETKERRYHQGYLWLR